MAGTMPKRWVPPFYCMQGIDKQHLQQALNTARDGRHKHVRTQGKQSMSLHSKLLAFSQGACHEGVAWALLVLKAQHLTCICIQN